MTRKELQEQYKARKVVGGVYRIVNTRTGRYLLQSTDNMESAHNLLRFSRSTNSCMMPPLQRDWREFGGEAFEIEELELLEKKETQTDREFHSDLEVLMELWSEKLSAENRY